MLFFESSFSTKILKCFNAFIRDRQNMYLDNLSNRPTVTGSVWVVLRSLALLLCPSISCASPIYLCSLAIRTPNWSLSLHNALFRVYTVYHTHDMYWETIFNDVDTLAISSSRHSISFCCKNAKSSGSLYLSFPSDSHPKISSSFYELY